MSVSVRLLSCALCLLGLLSSGCTVMDPGASDVRIVLASAQGLPAAYATAEPARRFTALESARQRALAKLAEELHGVRVERAAKVRDMQFAGEEIEAQVQGELKGAQVVRSEYDEETGLAEVTVRIGVDASGRTVPGAGLPLVPRLP